MVSNFSVSVTSSTGIYANPTFSRIGTKFFAVPKRTADGTLAPSIFVTSFRIFKKKKTLLELILVGTLVWLLGESYGQSLKFFGILRPVIKMGLRS